MLELLFSEKAIAIQSQLSVTIGIFVFDYAIAQSDTFFQYQGVRVAGGNSNSSSLLATGEI